MVCACAEEEEVLGACAVVGGVAEVGDDVVAFALGFDRAILQPVVRVCGLLVELPRRQRSHDRSVLVLPSIDDCDKRDYEVADINNHISHHVSRI